MKGLFADLFFILFSFLVSSHIILLNLLNELNFGVVSIKNELFVIGLRVQYTVDILQ